MTARRIVSISLPHFPMERWLRLSARTGDTPPDDLPVALAEDGSHGPVVYATNRPARLAGVRQGARITDMRALCPTLCVKPADPAGDITALDRLALWARRWCPWTVAQADGGLMLDTTGSDHLWGGEDAMLEEIEAGLALIGYSARLAVAPTQGAAWALARFGPVRAVSHEMADLHPLPVNALRLGDDTVLLLQRLGLKSVGDIAAIPRLSLARRFGRADLPDNPLLRLDQAAGRLAEPLTPPEAPPVFRAQMRFAEPLMDAGPCLPDLAADLCARLARAGQGARRLTLSVWRSDGSMRWIEASAAVATRDPAHLAFLFRDRLDRIDAGFGFDIIALDAVQSEPLAQVQRDLAGTPDTALHLSQLVDRLTARFGPRAVQQPAPRDSHIPERAETRLPPMAGMTGRASGRGPAAGDPPRGDGSAGAPAPAARSAARSAECFPDRPDRLLDPAEEVVVLYAVPEGPPAQFVWRRKSLRVTRYQGPERIAPEWWQDRPGTRLRDYFKIEDEAGRRYWLYREGLHGDGRGATPRWFLHGIFA